MGKEKKENNQVLKIKEDCLRIQERDIFDQVKNIDNENNKSGLVIGLMSAMITLGFKDLQLDFCHSVILFILGILPIIFSLRNIWSKSVGYHININNYFINRDSNYEGYLNRLHITNQEIYRNVSELLKEKSSLTKISYIFTIIFIIYILFIKLF